MTSLVRKDVTLLIGTVRMQHEDWRALLQSDFEFGRVYFMRNPFNLTRFMAVKIRESGKFVLANFNHDIHIQLGSVPPILIQHFRNLFQASVTFLLKVLI